MHFQGIPSTNCLNRFRSSTSNSLLHYLRAYRTTKPPMNIHSVKIPKILYFTLRAPTFPEASISFRYEYRIVMSQYGNLLY